MELAHEPPEHTFLQKMQEKLAASRFFTVSLLFHVGVLILVGGAVVARHWDEPADFSAEGGSGLVMEEVQQQPQQPQQEIPQQQVFTPTVPQVNTPVIDMIASNVATPTNFTVATVAMPSVKAPVSTDTTKIVNAAAGAAMGTGMRGLPGVMGGRAGGTQRTAARMAMGGKDKSEQAVLKGLRWLRDHQNDNGSWSNQGFTPSMTGLALLCFLGHGETPQSPEFGATVRKAIDYVTKRGTEFQGRLSMEKNISHTGVYEHAIVTYALGEYYSMTKDEAVKELLVQAVGYIVKGQAPDGGWQYGYSTSGDKDTSVTGWQIQALKAAHLTGLNIEGVDPALDKSMEYLKGMQGPNGGYGYKNAEDRYSLTGVGVLCTYFWKGDKDKSVREGIKFILDKSEKDKPVKYKEASCDLYAWYYHTQACLMYGGSAWTKWNRWFQDEITDNQSADGSWPVPAAMPKLPGPQNDPDKSGPFYRTTMCVLMLEVFYRYMPTTKA